MNHRPSRRVPFALACLLGISTTHAATWDWNNGTALWSDLNAWTPNAVPTSATDTILKFAGAGDTPYTSTNDLAGMFNLRELQLNSAATVEETIATSTGGVLGFTSDGITNPIITQSGSGAFNLNLGINAGSPLTFGGTGTGTVTLSGVIGGTGGLTFTGATWRIANTGNTFTGGLTINTGALVELAPVGAINITPGAATLVGSNAVGNPIVINGGTLKFTTTGNITFGDNRPLTFGVNGGVLDLRNSGVAGGGNIFNSGNNDLALTLNNTGNNLAVIKFNGGQNGLSTNTTNNGDWSSNNNSIRIDSYAGSGRVRIELENGAMFQNRPATVNVPVTVRGVIGGDPTSGPTGSVNANLSLNTGRMIFDITGTHNYAQGLIIEGAMQLSAAGQARALDGNVTLASGAYVAFNGRGTGTALGAPITAAGTSTANTQHPLYVGVGGNDTLTIQSGAIAVFDNHIRHEQANHNAVLMNARAVINGGAELRIYQSLSRATAVMAAAAGQINTNSTTALTAPHIIDGDIQGNGSTANEALLSIYLPAQPGNDTNGDQVPDDAFGDFGGVVFRNNSTGTTAGTNGSDIIVNGAGFGGLRVEGRARPNLLFDASGTVVDPVSNADKVANYLTSQRMAGITGTGGYLTAAPVGTTFNFPIGGDWSAGVTVGLKAVNHNPAGVDVSFAAISGFNHNLLVDLDATVDLGATSPFVFDNNATILGKGAIVSTGSVTINAGSGIAPGLNDLGALTLTTGNLTLLGDLRMDLTPTSADLLAVTGSVTLGGNLAVTGTLGTQDIVIASYSGTLTGTFANITGLSPLFSVDYGSRNNGVIKLAYNTSPTLTWDGTPGTTWSVGGGNWKGGQTYTNAFRARFDGTAAGGTSVSISGGDVQPLETLVHADTKNYTITSSAGAALAGAGPLTKTGAMILTLIGPATYAGGTMINEGTLALGSDNALPDVGLVKIAAGATLNTQAHLDTVGDLEVAGSVTGGGSLTVSSLTIVGGGSFTPNLVTNGSINKKGGPGTLVVPIDLNAGIRTISAEPDSAFTLTGVLSNGGIDKIGAGDLILAPTSANQHLGGTAVSAGKVIAQMGAIPVDSPVTVNTGGTLEIAGAQPLTVSSLSGTGGTITGANGITLNQGTTTTFAGSITGVTSVNMNGAGQITFSGASTYTGGLFVNSGRVLLTTNATAGGTGPIRVLPNGLLGSGTGLSSRVDLLGGTFMGIGSPASIATNDVVAGAGTTSTIALSDPLNVNTRSEMRVTGTLKGSGDLNVTISSNAPHPDGGVGFRLLGTGASDFSGTITSGKGVKFEAQTGQAGPFSPAGTGKLVFVAGSFTGGLNGDYSQFNVRNNFTGNTVMGNNVEVIGTGYVNMNMAGSAGAGNVTTLGNLRIGDQMLGVNKNGGATQVLEFTSVTLTGGDPTFAPTTVGFGASGTGDLRLGPISELVAGTGINLDGSNVLTLAAANTYTGATRVTNGTLRLGAPGALPANGSLVVNGGTVDLNGPTGSANQTTKSLSGTGGVITNSDLFSSRTLEVAQSADTVYAGTISGGMELKKTGSGVLALTGFVSGATMNVQGGILKVNGTLTNTPTVASGGGTLSGIGFLGAVEVGVGGVLYPGDLNPVTLAYGGTLSAVDVNFVLGSAIDLTIAKAAPGAQPIDSDFTKVKVSNSITLTNPDLDMSVGAGVETGDIFSIIINDGPGAINGTFFGRQQGDIFTRGGQAWQISYFDDASTPGIFELSGGNDVALLAVPEPGSVALILCGVALLPLRRRRAS